MLSSDNIYGVKDSQGRILGAKSGSKLDFRGVKYVNKLIYNTFKNADKDVQQQINPLVNSGEMYVEQAKNEGAEDASN